MQLPPLASENDNILSTNSEKPSASAKIVPAQIGVELYRSFNTAEPQQLSTHAELCGHCPIFTADDSALNTIFDANGWRKGFA